MNGPICILVLHTSFQYPHSFKMPSLNRPNAPERLPTSAIFDSLIFRSRQPEGSGQSSNSTTTATISPFSGSPLSPLTKAEQRRASKQDRRGSRLQSSPAGISPLAALDQIASDTKRRQSRSQGRHESYGSEKSISHSARSSISLKAKRILKLSSSRAVRAPSYDDTPPREAKEGFFWRYELSGRWLEIRLGDRRPSERTIQAMSSIKSLSNIPQTPGTADTEIASKVEKVMKSNGQPSPSPPAKNLLPLSSTPRHLEGLYDRTKKRLGIKSRGSRLLHLHHAQRSQTGEVLDRTSSRLRVIATRQQLPISNTPSASSHSSSARSVNLLKWPLLSSDTIQDSSSSSSLRSTIQGRPPEPTPELDEMYTAANNQQYFRTEMTGPGGPNFLPSEARRVNTPPLGGSRGKARGFFFDYKPPELNQAPFRGRMSRQPTMKKEGQELGESDATDRKMSVLDSTAEWYNVQLDVIDASDTSSVPFVMEIPDHLANSPLCPRHPKNKSGGKGTCPMHGRRETDESMGTASRDSEDAYCHGQTYKNEY